MGIFGVGSGLGYFPPIENCWKYYPTSNALIFGICVAGLGLSSSILTPLADFFIVNKNKEKTDSDGYYPEGVANNLKTYLYILTAIYVFLGVSAFLLAFEFKEEKKEDIKLIEDEENSSNGQRIEEVKEKKNISFKELILLFKTKKFLMILSFCICGLCKN
jgi:Na+/melibiose symporter-like transporter